MDLSTFLYGILVGLCTSAIWKIGSKKLRGYYQKKEHNLDFEIDKIRKLSKDPSEIYRDSLKNLFYLIFLIALANLIGLFHELIYQKIVYQHAFTEGGLWFVVASLSYRFQSRIESTYNSEAAIKELENKKEIIKKKY